MVRSCATNRYGGVHCVIVALVFDVDLPRCVEPARRIQRARSDRDRVAPIPIPEQRCAAFAAKTTSRESRRPVPFETTRFDQAKRIPRRRGVRAHVSVRLAAHGAMTYDDVAQRSARLVSDGAAEAAAGECLHHAASLSHDVAQAVCTSATISAARSSYRGEKWNGFTAFARSSCAIKPACLAVRWFLRAPCSASSSRNTLSMNSMSTSCNSFESVLTFASV